jgi:hypothetical protein
MALKIHQFLQVGVLSQNSHNAARICQGEFLKIRWLLEASFFMYWISCSDCRRKRTANYFSSGQQGSDCNP